jgi:hypothetical protein
MYVQGVTDTSQDVLAKYNIITPSANLSIKLNIKYVFLKEQTEE